MASMIGLAAAQAWIERHSPRLGMEMVPVATAAGRVLASAHPPLPPGPPIAAIDGYAVCAASTEGASDYAPLPVAAAAIQAGTALPAATDAVLPAHLFESGAALGAVAAGEGVAPPDPLALPAGTVVQPWQLGALVLRGEIEVAVVRRPVVAIHGALAPMLAALVEAVGGRVGAAPDLILHAEREVAFETVFADGVHLRPGETTALGTVAGVPALRLPTDPLGCLIAFALLAAPALRLRGGRMAPAPIKATLGRKIVSGLGQVEAVRVRVEDGVAMPAGPSLAAAADGLVLVPEGSEGYPACASFLISSLP